MRVRVLFFGILKELVGCNADELDLPEGSSINDLLAHYQSRVPAMKASLPSLALAVNQQYASPGTLLRPGDEVALLPPVSGGGPGPDGQPPGHASDVCADAATLSGRYAAIVRDPIDLPGVLSKLKRGDDGAALVFEGVVRNQTRGRQTLYLDYEAYEEMALQQMEGLAAEALQRFPIRDVALVHRLGRLEIGETSVLIAVVSAHRASAFDACRWLIDTLKRTVPIWKKEHFVDGSVWADGEPFPAEIPRANSSGEGSPGKSPASK